MNRPLISIVIPTYNRRSLLERALATVAAQTFGDWECLVCDDGSTDGTVQMVRAWGDRDSRFRVINGPRFGLPAGPRNRGIRQAKGAWIAFLDDDDVWHPAKLACQALVLLAGQADAVSTCYKMVPPDAQPKLQSSPMPTGTTPIALPDVLGFREPYPATSANVVRRECLVRVGAFDESPALRAVEDYDLWCRLLTLPGFRFEVLDGCPLALIRDEGADSISAWNRPLDPDVIRQRWAILNIMSRTFRAQGANFGAEDRRAITAALLEASDDCAARSVAAGWRRSACAGYAIASCYSAQLARPGQLLRRLLRLIRFGILGQPRAPAAEPEAVAVLRRATIRCACAGLSGGRPARDARTSVRESSTLAQTST